MRRFRWFLASIIIDFSLFTWPKISGQHPQKNLFLTRRAGFCKKITSFFYPSFSNAVQIYQIIFCPLEQLFLTELL